MTLIDQEDLKKELEAILFAAGRKVELEELGRLLKIKDMELLKTTLEALKHEYDLKNSPLLLTPEGSGWKLTVREKYLPLVREISPHTELAKALLETLAIIAWKQPILQSDVIKIRSSAAYEHIAQLLELGFINREKKGRSYALKVTGKFFDYFDLPAEQQAVDTLFKDVTSTAEALQQLDKEEQKKLGQLDVYPVPESKSVKPEHIVEQALGSLEVYETTAQKQEQIQEQAQENTGEQATETLEPTDQTQEDNLEEQTEPENPDESAPNAEDESTPDAEEVKKEPEEEDLDKEKD